MTSPALATAPDHRPSYGAAAIAGFVVFAWRDVHEFHVPVEEVARVDRARRAAREALLERMAQQGALP